MVFTSWRHGSRQSGHHWPFAHGCKQPGRVLILCVEHPAVLACAEEITPPGASRGGNPRHAPRARRTWTGWRRTWMTDVRMICCMQVNNESGAIQPLDGNCSRLRDVTLPAGGLSMWMACRASCARRLDFRGPADLQSYAFSAHKIHGPKGDWRLDSAQGASRWLAAAAWRRAGGRPCAPARRTRPGILGMGEAVRAYPAGERPRR